MHYECIFESFHLALRYCISHTLLHSNTLLRHFVINKFFFFFLLRHLAFTLYYCIRAITRLATANGSRVSIRASSFVIDPVIFFTSILITMQTLRNDQSLHGDQNRCAQNFGDAEAPAHWDVRG